MDESISLPENLIFHNHQLIFDALLQLHNENKEADEILIAEKLSASNNLEKIGGKDALFELSSRIDTTAHAPYWLDLVKEKAVLRKCIYILNYPGKKDHPLWHFPVMLCLTSNHGYILLGSRLVEVAPKCPSV